MGHTRLGLIPKTRKWRAVVELMAAKPGDNGTPLADRVPSIAQAALEAAQSGLDKARREVALKQAFYLLARIVLASRAPDWLQKLREIGLTLPQDPTAVDLTIEAQAALDEYIERNKARSDIAELVQQAFGEALTDALAPRAVSLFGAGREELHSALRELSTKNGFADLSQIFFARFVSRFLNFYLSRVTSGQLDSPAIPQLGDLSNFNRALLIHCEQSAKIVRDFSGDWYSKTEYEEGITQANVGRFIAVALKKLQAELEAQKGGA